MIKKALVEHCAPILAGIKTGSIFSVRCDRIIVNDEIRKMNKILVGKGLRLVPVKNKGDSVMIF